MEQDVGSLLVYLDMALSPFEKATGRANDIMTSMVQRIESSGTGMSARVVNSLSRIGDTAAKIGAPLQSAGTALGLAGAAISGSLIATAYEFSNVGDMIDKMSKRLGIGVEQLTALQYAAELSGASISDLENGFRFLQRSVGEAASGSKEAVDRFAQIGIPLEKLKGMRPEQQFDLVADAISKIKDPARQTQVAMDLFSRGGTKLLPMLQEGADGLKRMKDEAERLGYTLSAEEVKAAAELNDQLGRLKLGMTRMAMAIGMQVMPVLMEWADWVKDHVKMVKEWAANNGGLIRGIVYLGGAMTIAGSILFSVGMTFIWLSSTISAVNQLIIFAPKIWAALTAVLSPVGLAIGLMVVALVLCAEALGLVDIGLLKWINHLRIGGIEIGTYLKDAGIMIQQVWESVAYGIEYALLNVKGVAIDVLAIAAKALQYTPGMKGVGSDLAAFAGAEQEKNASRLKWFDRDHEARMKALDQAERNIYDQDNKRRLAGGGKAGTTAVETAAGGAAASASGHLVSSTNFQVMSTGRMSLAGVAGESTSAKTQQVNDPEVVGGLDTINKTLQGLYAKGGILAPGA